MRSCDHRNIMILYQGFPNWGVPLVICKPLKSGTRAALCQEQGGGRSWFSADLEETGKGCLGSECCSKCQMLPLWLSCPVSRSCCCLSQEGRAQEDVRGGRGAEGQQCTHAHTLTHTHTKHTALMRTIHAHLPQALRCSELTVLDNWAPGLPCSQSKHHSIPPSLLLYSPGAPGA